MKQAERFGSRLPITTATTTADPETLDRLEDRGLVAFRYCGRSGEISDEENFNGSARAIAGIFNETRTVLGLMPHPENATDPLLGGTDGRAFLRRAGERAAVNGESNATPALAAEHGLTNEEFERVVAILRRAPNPTELGIFLGDVERTLFVQIVKGLAPDIAYRGTASDLRARRECRGRRYRRR